MRDVRVFVSSPCDVALERQRIRWIADQLNGRYPTVRFETILWEETVYNAHDGGFQAQIVNRAKPAECDIVIAIFWGRLGSELPDEFPERMLDGKPYPSGTAYELLSALQARKSNRRSPDVFVFGKTARVNVPVNDKSSREEAINQWNRLTDFFAHYFEPSDKRIIRVIEKFNEIGEFERKVKTLLEDWIKKNVSQGPRWNVAVKGSPFRGLEPFDAKHTDVYCGRDRKVQRAIDELKAAALRQKPFLLIPGASGSGKSSLMRAGIAPRLTKPGAVSGIDVWRVAVMRPATDGRPMLALARSLFVAGGPRDDPGGFGKALPELADEAFNQPEHLAQLFSDSTELSARPILAVLDRVGATETQRLNFERPLKANLLLLVDQLEDIFAAGVTAEHRGRFAKLLDVLVGTQRVWVITTLRGDMYERMITERPFIALKDRGGQFDLSPPGPDELDEIVHRSAEVAGLKYEDRSDGNSATSARSERLDDRLLRDAAGENTLPLLEFALNLLFDKCWREKKSKVLAIAAYEEIGGLDGAIDQTAEMAMARLVQPDGEVRYPLPKDVQADIEKTIDPTLEVLLRKLVMPIGPEQQNAEGAGNDALTSRIVPMATFRRDQAASRLIDALLHARILLAMQSAQGSFLRLAHDRVMTSWERARRTIERNRDFYRVKAAIEDQRRRWEENKRSSAFLIPSGAPITQAEEKVQQFADEFSEETLTFVTKSSRRARLRYRLLAASSIVFAIVAVLATGASWYATVQRKHATANYELATRNYLAARDTVNGLVISIGGKLQDLDGISVEAVQTALEEVERAITKLEAENPKDVELQQTRAMMHFQFAAAFKNVRNLDRALVQAENGLAIRNDLAAQPAARRDWLEEKAESLDQVGDIHRAKAQDLDKARDSKAAKSFDDARRFFEQARAIRTQLLDEQPDNPLWTLGMANSLVRIGDLKTFPGKDIAGAKADYEAARDGILKVIRNKVEEKDLMDRVLRELSWDYNKVGDALLAARKSKDLATRLENYERALCIRKYLASLDRTNMKIKRDVAVSLEKVGDAKSLQNDSGAEEALFEDLMVRKELVGNDPSKTLWLTDLGKTLHMIGKFFGKAKKVEMSAGFFAQAVEVRTKVAAKLAAQAADAALKNTNQSQAQEHARLAAQAVDAAIRDTNESRGELDQAIKNLSGATRLNATEKENLVKRLEELADKQETKMIQQIQERPQDPVADWNSLKGRLLGSLALQQASANVQ